MTVLVTGNAGFIGFHVARQLLERGQDVIGFDSVNDYYDPALKQARLAELDKTAAASKGRYSFIRADLADRAAIEKCFGDEKPDTVIHLAAQAGIGYSLENPHAYVESNLVGFTNILEACRHYGVSHLVYASTSSVYGANTALPFSEHQPADHPLQFYAATKRANEMMAHAYSHLFRLPTTGLRFFTVYGPWGRPDMALSIFTRNILAGKPIDVFDHGNHTRDFTYIDDVVAGVLMVADAPARPDPDWNGKTPDPASSGAPFRIYNIGNTRPVKLTSYIEAIEDALGMKAEKNLLPRRSEDVPDTHSDVTLLAEAFGYAPKTSVREGVGTFVDWYRAYYGGA
ncbi:NAD-dependent epimerase [Mesorhizobium xinjiangense]|uniref:NAD-dependent epimerase n=1 Tax=Mesorhizobium xinjiangense TaxID=2678685 RepID=UPI0012ED33D7|nr:NAD-dependent epimerase [Mesorhizobium xinjiangense]